MSRSRLVALAALVVVLLVGLALPIAHGRLEERVRVLVEDRIARATGTAGTVGAVELGAMLDSFVLRNLAIANPGGFESPSVVAIESVAAAGDLRARPIALARLELTGVHLTVERSEAGINLRIVKDHADESRAARDDADEKRFAIDEVAVDGLRLTGSIAARRGGPAISLDHEFEPTALEDLGTDGDGIALPDLIRAIVRSLAGDALSVVTDRLPDLDRNRVRPPDGGEGRPRDRLRDGAGDRRPRRD